MCVKLFVCVFVLFVLLVLFVFLWLGGVACLI